MNTFDCLEIRLESIGGLGANLCGKMLGELGALYLSLNASSFSSYGSEKRGSPVKSYVRWCKEQTPIRVNSPILSPDLLCIFHEGLLESYPVLEGVTEHTKVILNTPLTPGDALSKWNFRGAKLVCVDALKIAMDCHSRINMVLLGAITKAADIVPLSCVENLCKDTIGQKYPNLIEANLEGIRRGFQSVAQWHCTQSVADNHAPKSSVQEQYIWGYDNAPLGGINTRPGSTVSNDLSPSREGYIPLFIPERCIHCGLCDSTCPDMVFQFQPKERDGKTMMTNCGLDYYHCKGCLRCVEVCPTNALVQATERDYPQKPWFTPNQHLLPDAISYEKSGPNSWVTSDSYLTEKRVDGGVV